jgi:hypothetical protein
LIHGFSTVDFQRVWRRKSGRKGETYVEQQQKPGTQPDGCSPLTPNEIEQVAAAKVTFASVLITAPVSSPDETFDQ